jgi:folate-binding protein YgfZ
LAPMTKLAWLPDRGVLAVGGEDRIAFLQGLVSNDVAAAAPGRAVWAALLTPQGKYLADFFILDDGARLLLDCERAAAPELLRRLARFRLRARVDLADLSAAWHVHAAWDGPPPPVDDAVLASDPRLPEAGWRVLAERMLATNADPAAWHAHRIALGLPDGTHDLVPEKTVLLEAGFDELGGVSWSKGCYMGQELTARTKYRGLVKRRLVPVAIAGPPPPPGTPVLAEGIEVGTMGSSAGAAGLALLRLDALARPLACAGATLSPRVPGWMRLPEAVG